MKIVPSQMHVLIADDQPDVLEALRLLLKRDGYKIESAESPQQALQAIENRDFDLAMIDLNYSRDTTSGQEGLDLLASIQKLDASLPVIVMTAWSSVDIAIEAMRRRSSDFVHWSWENERLLSTVRTHLELSEAIRR